VAPGPNFADGELLSSGEVAAMFHVTPKTVAQWAHRGKLSVIWTPGGHRRYRFDEVQGLLGGSTHEVGQ
jgi:excisionase family DNA binding protein